MESTQFIIDKASNTKRHDVKPINNYNTKTYQEHCYSSLFLFYNLLNSTKAIKKD